MVGVRGIEPPVLTSSQAITVQERGEGQIEPEQQNVRDDDIGNIKDVMLLFFLSLGDAS